MHLEIFRLILKTSIKSSCAIDYREAYHILKITYTNFIIFEYVYHEKHFKQLLHLGISEFNSLYAILVSV